MANQSTRKNQTRKKQGKTQYKSAKTKTRVLSRMIKRIVGRGIETQSQSWSWILTPLSLQNTTGTLANNYMILNPSSSTSGLGYTINRGTGSGQMVGDKISVKRVMFNYVLSLDPGYNATTNPNPGRAMFVRFYFYTWKRQPLNDPQTNVICGTGPAAQFFEIGTDDIGFISGLEDLNQSVNTDQFRLFKTKTFKLGNAIPYNGASGIGVPTYPWSNNDFKMSAFGKINITKMFRKTLTRDDDGVWMDPYIICLVQWVYADGLRPTNITVPLKLTAEVDLHYKDA